MAGQFDIHSLLLAVGQVLRVESTLRPVAYLIVSVQSGVLDVWNGDNAQPTGNPHWRFRAGSPALTIPLLPQRTIGQTAVITCLGVNRAVQATVTFYGGVDALV